MDDIGTFGRRSVARHVSTDSGTASADGAAFTGDFVPADEKYQVEGPIGRGGMGEVILVSDRDLKRQVAMKVLRAEVAASNENRVKFVAEAQATSQLEHPGIPPVHDIGISPSGRIYFTMKLVRGRTLAEVLKDLFLGVRAVRREFTLHKLVSILEQITEALHFAHERGVIHRDIKPDNVMLGDFGEVHVMDWGIAKVASEAGDDADEADEFRADHDVIRTAADDILFTQVGTVKGTIPYMSPEQARGDADLDRRSDVYAIGCLLYEMLTLHRAFEGDGLEILTRIRKGDFPPIAERDPRRPVPEALADLSARAMSLDREDRPATARVFGSELRGWLDGRAERARKHKEAEALAAQGIEAMHRFESLQLEADEAERAAEKAKGDFKPWQPVSEISPLTDAREKVTDLRREIAVAMADATTLLNAALVAEATNTTASHALADLWAGRLADAERRGADDDVAHALTMIGRYDDGRLAPLISGDGVLELASDPRGAEVLISRYEKEEGVLVPKGEVSLGTTPVARSALPMGSYLCVLRKSGHRDVRYPVHISRGRTWKATVRLLSAKEIGAEFVFVPGGPFVYGEVNDATVREIPDFLMRRTPVTFGEWAEFLHSVEAEKGIEAAAALIPSVKGDGDFMKRGDDGVYRPLPNIVEGATRKRCIAERGEGFELEIAVAGISWHDAVAYCKWKTKATGREWRLPTEEEREKAARGVDGRRFPWGDLEHASLCKNSQSRDEPAQPEPVGAFPTAVSAYGMVDAAGSFWEWTSSLFEPQVKASESRVIRGGGWSAPVGGARAAFRGRYAPDFRSPNVGFRPARSVI